MPSVSSKSGEKRDRNKGGSKDKIELLNRIVDERHLGKDGKARIHEEKRQGKKGRQTPVT